ncbi:MAG: hypothetical protein ACXWV4_03985 [Flavitalea sp.]
MKALLFCLIFFIVACDQQEEKSTIGSEPVEAETKPVKPTPTYPYTAAYSSDFEMGDPEHTVIIMNVWKAYENNTLDSSIISYFADSMRVETPEGPAMSMTSSDMLKEVSKQRGTMKNMQVSVEGAVPLYSKDKKSSWVLIYGNESWTGSNGKKDSIMLHELWGLNEQGKVNFMRSYTKKPLKN